MQQKRYTIGVMKTPAEDPLAASFDTIVDAAIAQIKDTLTQDMELDVHLFEFVGPHLLPTEGAYAPLDFLQLGISEKLERNINFLIIVTEVDLTATDFSYVLALPSQLTNIGIVSTKRISPAFWGYPADSELATKRLASLMLHTIGHLLNIAHSEEPANAMYDFEVIEDLEKMHGFTDEQIAQMRRNIPNEARDQVSADNRWTFAVQTVFQNWSSIWHAVLRANPLYLITRLPTMVTAALSVMIVLIFSAETWDVGSTVDLWQLVLFSIIVMIVGTFVLYRAFTFGATIQRTNTISESAVVTEAATLLSLLLTLTLLYAVFFLLMYLTAITVFPRRLMATWPTVDPAIRTIDHVKLSMFLAAMGVLAGSLGGRADRKDVIRNVLFLDEET